MGKCEISGLLPWPWRGRGTSLRQMLRFTLRQVSARSRPAPSLGARMLIRGSACALFARVQRHQDVNNRRIGCIWNGGVAQDVNVVYFRNECRSGNRLSFSSLDLLLYVSNHSWLKCCVAKLAVNQKYPSNKTDLLQITLFTQKHLHWTDWSLTGCVCVKRHSLRMIFLGAFLKSSVLHQRSERTVKDRSILAALLFWNKPVKTLMWEHSFHLRILQMHPEMRR